MWFRLTDRPDMTLDVYRGRKTTIQQLIWNVSEQGIEWRLSGDFNPLKAPNNFCLSKKIRLDVSCESSARQKIKLDVSSESSSLMFHVNPLLGRK